MKYSRIAIFIDFNNFQIRFREVFGDYPIWETLNRNLLNLVNDHVLGDISKIDYSLEHIGTWVCAGVPDCANPDQERFMKWLEVLDRMTGYIVKYGRVDNHNREKGVDTEIVCQLLMGAFNDQYDIALLMSDDSDFLPAVERVQDIFGKRVLQAGFNPGAIIRAHCYGHIPLERCNRELTKIFGEHNQH
ncbi:MAG: NYN domain-containing protein [Spirochaetia bacterium]